MKFDAMKSLTLFITLFLCTAEAFAQNPNGWVQQGAKFYHTISGLTEGGYVRYYLDEEFEVNGKMLQRLKALKKNSFQAGPNPVENELVEVPGSRLFHTSNDTAYFANEQGNLRFAWHLNPQVGDVWDFGPYSLSTTQTEIHAYAIVTAVADVEIDGVMSKDITISTCIDAQGTPTPDSQDQTESYLWVFHEGIINTVFGPRTNFHYMGFYEISPLGTFCPSNFTNLTCFLSNSTPLVQMPGITSCTGGLANVENDEHLNFKLYPNPSSTSFTFTNPEQIKQIQLFDAQGRLQSASSVLPFNVRGMSAGMYWVRGETINGANFVEKLLVE